MIMWAHWQEDWLLYHKVIFDGVTRTIIVNSNEPVINIKEDIYSSWKEWAKLRDNGKFLPAIRAIGGDPTQAGAQAGDIYFLINNWRILVTNDCNISGTLYSDDYDSPYLSNAEVKVVRNTVSNLVQSLGAEVTITPNVTPETVWNYLLEDARLPGTIGERLNQLLTIAKFLGLK